MSDPFCAITPLVPGIRNSLWLTLPTTVLWYCTPANDLLSLYIFKNYSVFRASEIKYFDFRFFWARLFFTAPALEILHKSPWFNFTNFNINHLSPLLPGCGEESQPAGLEPDVRGAQNNLDWYDKFCIFFIANLFFPVYVERGEERKCLQILCWLLSRYKKLLTHCYTCIFLHTLVFLHNIFHTRAYNSEVPYVMIMSYCTYI